MADAVTADCNNDAWKCRSALPSLVVPSGNTATRSPTFNTSAISAFIRAVSLRLVRSMNSVPALRLNQPNSGQPRISALATKRAGQTTFREYTSSQEIALAASITRWASAAGGAPEWHNLMQRIASSCADHLCDMRHCAG